MFQTEIEAIRLSMRRDAPLGSEPWVLRTAATLGLESRAARSHLSERVSYLLHLSVATHDVLLTIPYVPLTIPAFVKESLMSVLF
jgi:hypothetical protein